jgi:hypothetical protein
MALVNLGAGYPEQLLTLVLKASTKGLAKEIEGKTISVTIEPTVGSGGVKGGK